MSGISPEKIITNESSRWLDCEGTPEMTLLRLGILRELNQTLHFEKSRNLANGLKAEVQVIKEWEGRIEKLRDSLSLNGDLMNLLTHQDSLQKKTRVLPESLFFRLEREKLVRFDRKWEAIIAAEAVAIRWPFWSFETWVKIPLIEEWNKTFVEALWPRGLVLFSESSSPNSSSMAYEEKDENPIWRGRWVIVLDRNFKSPNELSLNFNQWPGVPDKLPAPHQWKCLYP